MGSKVPRRSLYGFHWVVNVVNFTVNGIYIANNWFFCYNVDVFTCWSLKKIEKFFEVNFYPFLYFFK